MDPPAEPGVYLTKLGRRTQFHVQRVPDYSVGLTIASAAANHPLWDVAPKCHCQGVSPSLFSFDITKYLLKSTGPVSIEIRGRSRYGLGLRRVKQQCFAVTRFDIPPYQASHVYDMHLAA